VLVTRCDLAIRADDHAVFRLETDDAGQGVSASAFSPGFGYRV
jgi:hypothetical protein